MSPRLPRPQSSIQEVLPAKHWEALPGEGAGGKAALHATVLQIIGQGDKQVELGNMPQTG